MAGQAEIQNKLAALMALAPMGFAMALHVRFTTPTFLFQTYDRKWLDVYTKRGYVMSDPAVHWGFENRGVRTWTELAYMDTAGVFKAAAEHNLNYGLICALGDDSSPSFCACASDKREFTQEETDEIMGHLNDIHALTDNLQSLSPETAAALKEMSVLYTHPSDN